MTDIGIKQAYPVVTRVRSAVWIAYPAGLAGGGKSLEDLGKPIKSVD